MSAIGVYRVTAITIRTGKGGVAADIIISYGCRILYTWVRLKVLVITDLLLSVRLTVFVAPRICAAVIFPPLHCLVPILLHLDLSDAAPCITGSIRKIKTPWSIRYMGVLVCFEAMTYNE